MPVRRHAGRHRLNEPHPSARGGNMPNYARDERQHSDAPSMAASGLTNCAALIRGQEPKRDDIAGGTPMCVRVMAHLDTDIARADLRHVYLEGAKTLRDDLPG